MAASQSLTEGLPPSAKPSFADMVRGTTNNIREPFKEAALHKGEPALLFSDPEVADLSAPLRFALIGKFAAERPSMEFLRRGFKTIGFKGDFRLGLMDPKHILIRFDLEEDYHRCWLHNSWRFKDHVMKVLKWTPEFSAKEEPPIVPVWVSFEQLPLFLFAQSPLFSLGRILGNPLKLDAATLSLSRPSVARVCVELDLRNSLPSRIWIGFGQNGFWQPVTYENLPDYCFDCRSLGHAQPDCGKQLSLAPNVTQIWRVKPTQPSSSQPPSVALVAPQPPTGSLVQDTQHLPIVVQDTQQPPAQLDVPAPSSGKGVVHVHGTVDEQLGPAHQQLPSETVHVSTPVHAIADHTDGTQPSQPPADMLLVPVVSSPVVSNVCLPPVVSAPGPSHDPDVFAVVSASDGVADPILPSLSVITLAPEADVDQEPEPTANASAVLQLAQLPIQTAGSVDNSLHEMVAQEIGFPPTAIESAPTAIEPSVTYANILQRSPEKRQQLVLSTPSTSQTTPVPELIAQTVTPMIENIDSMSSDDDVSQYPFLLPELITDDTVLYRRKLQEVVAKNWSDSTKVLINKPRAELLAEFGEFHARMRSKAVKDFVQNPVSQGTLPLDDTLTDINVEDGDFADGFITVKPKNRGRGRPRKHKK